MEYFIESLKAMPWWIFLIAGIFVVYFIFYLIYMRKRNDKKTAFRETHPEVSSVYAESKIKGIKSVQITILQVDGVP